MMKKIPFLCCCWLALLVHPAQSDPLDLIGFTPDPVYDSSINGGVDIISDSEINFFEYADSSGLASDVTFYNDYFHVDNDVTELSFDYEFSLGTDDYDDYFVFEFIQDYDDYSSPVVTELDTYTDDHIGHITFDLTSYRGQDISLSWSLVWGGDGYFNTNGDWIADIAGSSARIYNLDLEHETGGPSPIPEPTTILLFGTGLVGLAGMRRRKTSK